MSGQIDLSKKLVVIADDLTGALDSVGPLSDNKHKVVVATCPEAFSAALDCDARITAVSTRSRDLPPHEAKERVAQIAAALPADVIIFKKIDSRLKGNLASELSALPDRPFWVAPAIPEFGRLVAQETVAGMGIHTPISIRPLLGEKGHDAFIPDINSTREFDTALADVSDGTILIGARGLSSALARAMHIETYRPNIIGRVAIAVGSVDPITNEQVKHLERYGAAVYDSPNGIYLGAPPSEDIAVLRAVTGDKRIDSSEVAHQLATSFLNFCRNRKNLILTGGATAESIVDALELQILNVLGEVLPGLPLSRSGDFRIVTKSGGFGAADTLSRLVGLSTETSQ